MLTATHRAWRSTRLATCLGRPSATLTQHGDEAAEGDPDPEEDLEVAAPRGVGREGNALLLRNVDWRWRWGEGE